MRNLSPFQLVIFGICGALILFGVIVFAALNRFGGSQVGTVVIWGTIPQSSMDTLLQTLRTTDSSFQGVSYVQKDPATYDTDLLNAIASGAAPDLALISQEEVIPFENKLQLIPYTAVSKGQYQTSFIGEGDLFLAPQGIIAMPFTIDPLVMYWNKDLFAAAGIPNPPQYWDEMLTDTPKLTTLSASQSIQTSAIAMGEWSNVTDAKAILAALTLQAGDPIVEIGQNGAAAPVFGTQSQQSIEAPAASALRFYTDFADPSKTSYTWNRTMPLSQEAFAAGTVAVYIGFASEYPVIAARNPNLTFGVASLPQAQGETTPLTIGNIEGLAIPRGTKNYTGATIVAQLLSQDAGAGAIAAALGLPPVLRDLITSVPNNPAQSTFMQSALIAHGWLDPDPAATDTIFETMVESVLSGQNQPAEAVAQAALALQQLFPQQTP